MGAPDAQDSVSLVVGVELLIQDDTILGGSYPGQEQPARDRQRPNASNSQLHRKASAIFEFSKVADQAPISLRIWVD
jgi:hypothetical protein